MAAPVISWYVRQVGQPTWTDITATEWNLSTIEAGNISNRFEHKIVNAPGCSTMMDCTIKAKTLDNVDYLVDGDGSIDDYVGGQWLRVNSPSIHNTLDSALVGNGVGCVIKGNNSMGAYVVTSSNKLYRLNGSNEITDTIKDPGLNKWSAITTNGTNLLVISNGNTDKVTYSGDGSSFMSHGLIGNYNSVVFADSKYVAVGDLSTAVATDGINWTTTSTAYTYNSVCYGLGMFVAVGRSGKITTSTDGITWVDKVSNAVADLNSIIYANGQFVVVYSNGVLTSPDGINWTVRTAAADRNWVSVTYGNSLYVAVADSGGTDRIMKSADGITWSTSLGPNDNDWKSIIYTNKFVAVATLGLGFSTIMESTDAITWTAKNGPFEAGITGILYTGSTYYFISNDNVGNRIASSTDLATYNTYETQTYNNHKAVAAGLGKFVVVDNSGSVSRILYSINGVDYNLCTVPVVGSWSDIAFSTDTFMAVSSDGYVVKSTDGVIWTQESLPQAGSFIKITGFGASEFLAVDTNNYIFKYTGGVWTVVALSGAFMDIAGNQFTSVVVADSGTDRIYRTEDGIVFTPVTPPIQNAWSCVAYGNNKWVILSRLKLVDNDNILISEDDGITWTNPLNSNLEGLTWKSITYGNGVFTAVAYNSDIDGDSIIYSEDGITWSTNNTQATTLNSDIAYGVTPASSNIIEESDYALFTAWIDVPTTALAGAYEGLTVVEYSYI